MGSEEKFLPEYIHVLVIDDKIGDEKYPHHFHFDHNLKSNLNKEFKSCSTKLILHYISDPTKLSEMIGYPKPSDKEIPIDLILVDINFHNIVKNDETDSNTLKELLCAVGNDSTKIGIELVRYIYILNSIGVLQVPLLIMTGDEKYFVENQAEDDEKYIKLLKENIKNFILLKQNKQLTEDLLIEDLLIKKTDDEKWFDTLTEKIIFEIIIYYNEVNFKKEFKSRYILNRINKEIKYFKKQDEQQNKIKKNNLLKNLVSVKYPKYNIKVSTTSNITKTEITRVKPVLSLELNLGHSSSTNDFSFKIPENLGESLIKQISDIARKIANDKNLTSYKSKIEIKFEEYYGGRPVNKNNKNNKNNIVEFGGCKFNSPFFIASTPATGFTGVGEDKDIVNAFLNKLLNIYEKYKPGGIILKTIILDTEENNTNSNIRQVSVTRCYTENNTLLNKKTIISNGTLFNTGKTKKETITIAQLNLLMSKIEDLENRESFKNSIILNIGSKKDDRVTWIKGFKKIFAKGQCFKFIEINARYTMRGISRNGKNGNNGFDVDEYFITEDINDFWCKFKTWINLIHDLGVAYEKKIMIKLPYRSDLNILIKIIKDVANIDNSERKHGITSISLINTIKSPFVNIEKNTHDSHKIPQVSGEQLSSLRNIALYVAKSILGNNSLDISASGSIMTEKDAKESLELGAKTVQIASTLLINGNQNWWKSNKIRVTNPETLKYYQESMKESKIARRLIKFYPERCTSCGKCINTYYCDAFLNKFNSDTVDGDKLIPKSPIINYNFCTGCGLCAQVCDDNALELIYENALKKTEENKQFYEGVEINEDGEKLDECCECEGNEKQIFIYPKEKTDKNKYCCSDCKKQYDDSTCKTKI